MFRGYYLAANGILNQQRIIDTTANNMTNSQTAGYKTDTNIPTTFHEQLLLLNGKKSETGTIGYRKNDYKSTSLEQGSFEQTGSRLDVALKGNVYFNIQPKSAMYDDAGDKLLTRNGQFDIDDEGYLALGSAGRVMGKDGPIQLGTADFSIDDTGLITTEEGQTYQLDLTYVDDNTDVIKKGDNMFTLAEDTEATGEIPEGAEYAVVQGAYESSNVNVADQTTKAMAAQSNFTTCSQIIKMFDAMNTKTSTEIGKI